MKNSKDFNWALMRLERVSIRLKLVSATLLTFTLVNLSFILATLGGAIYVPSSFITALGIIVIFFVFFASLLFDSLRKDGKTYYDELSGFMHASSDEIDSNHDSIRPRISMRKFMNSYDIPLIPGKYGPGILVVLNIIIVILWVAMAIGKKL